jgi:hypothetical protein
VADPCLHVHNVCREVDFGEAARDFIEAASADIAEIDLVALGHHCATAAIGYLERNRRLLLPPTPHMSELGLASYDRDKRVAIIRSAVLSVPAIDRIGWRAGLDERFGLDDAAEPVIAGEGEYVRRHVLPGFLAGTPRNSTKAFFQSYPRFPPVRDTSRQTAIDAATDLIEAASRMTSTVPASSGIGGPIAVRVLSAIS